VLVHVFDGTLRLLHPLVPFVTEHLWDRIPWPEGAGAAPRPEALPEAPWPDGHAPLVDAGAEAAFAAFQELVAAVRSLRKEYGVGEGAEVPVVLVGAPAGLRAVRRGRGGAPAAVRPGGPRWPSRMPRGPTGWGPPPCSRTAPSSSCPWRGSWTWRGARAAGPEIERLDGQLKGADAKLANENFTGAAPAEVVEKEREKAESLPAAARHPAGEARHPGGGVRHGPGPGIPPRGARRDRGGSPGGMRPDHRSPREGPCPSSRRRVVRTVPDTFAVVEPFDGPVRIEFERTLAERLTTGALRDAVVVSPLTGEVEMSQRRTRLEINMEGGFPAGAVYRITCFPASRTATGTPWTARWSSSSRRAPTSTRRWWPGS
jgi:hypothetical protein